MYNDSPGLKYKILNIFTKTINLFIFSQYFLMIIRELILLFSSRFAIKRTFFSAKSNRRRDISRPSCLLVFLYVSA